MKVLVERSMDQSPKKRGNYIGRSRFGLDSWEPFLFDGKEWEDAFSMRSWFEEIELPTDDEIKIAANNYLLKIGSVDMKGNIFFDWTEGAQYVLDKLTGK